MLEAVDQIHCIANIKRTEPGIDADGANVRYRREILPSKTITIRFLLQVSGQKDGE
jgi:hypothetical protein